MPPPAYVAIPDTAIDPESPITESLMKALRDNMLSIIQGGAGAPRMGPGLLSLGGTGVDGALNNATSFSGPGYYDFSSITRSNPLALPYFSFIRVNGDCTISGTLTVDGVDSALQYIAANAYDGYVGPNGGDGGSIFNRGQGGGGSIGAGGNGWSQSGTGDGGIGGVGLDLSTASRPWINAIRKPIFGGHTIRNTGAGTQYKGGGAVILMVDGNLNMTGGTIQANGVNGENLGAGAGNSSNVAGSGGGTVIVVCSKTLTGGTFKANGGNGGTANPSGSSNDYAGGGGGGGMVVVLANAFSGSQVVQASGGTGGANSTAGGSGIALASTLAEQYANGLLWRP